MPTGIYKHRPHSEETRRKMSKGRKHSEETKKNIKENHSHHWLGKKFSKETKQKMSESQKGKKHTEKSKRMMSLKHRGKKLTIEHREKLSEAHRGAKSNLWKGGISYEPYSINWTTTLRRAIRERDQYICKLCNKLQSDRAFPIHHIDYNKENCNPDNLITLCCECHSKTNFNRKYWEKILKNNV